MKRIQSVLVFLAATICAQSETTWEPLPTTRNDVEWSLATVRDTGKRGATIQAADTVLPFLPEGGGFRSTIRFANLEPREVEIRVFFVSGDGKPFPMQIENGPESAALRGRIPPLGVIWLRTANVYAGEDIPWAFFDAGGARVAAQASIEQVAEEGPWRPGSYLASSIAAKRIRMLFDQTAGTLQLTLVNLNDEAVTATVLVRASNGGELTTLTRRIAALSTEYIQFDEIDEVKERRGTLEVSIPTESRAGIAAIGTQFRSAEVIDDYDFHQSIQVP